MPGGTTRTDVLAAVTTGIGFLLDAQWTQGPAAGSFSRVSAACAPADPRSYEVRIDYVQHALAAMRALRSLHLPASSTMHGPVRD